MNNEDKPVFRLHGIEFDSATGTVFVEGKPIPLGKIEFGVLAFLARNAGTTYSRQQIIAAIQGADYPATDRSVDMQIAGLRKKLGAWGKRVETVRGKGYRFQSAPAP